MSILSKEAEERQRLVEDFLRGAKEFCTAAESLSGASPLQFRPTFYCALHGIELALKALLIFHGVEKGMLASRKFGHNLPVLLAEAVRIGAVTDATLDSIDRKIITNGTKDYARKCFEYPEDMHPSTRPIGRWCAIGQKLITAGEQCLSLSDQTVSCDQSDA